MVLEATGGSQGLPDGINVNKTGPFFFHGVTGP